MEWLSNKPIHLVADREFASPKLAFWLKTTYNVDSTLRIKANMYLKGEEEPEIKVATLIHKMIKGGRRVLYDQILTRASTFKMNVLLTWGKEYDEPLVVATTSGSPVKADIVYGKRFGIEPMHWSSFKTTIHLHWCSVKEFYWLVADVFGQKQLSTHS